MKHEIEGEIYFQKLFAGQDDFDFSYMITSEMNRDNIIYSHESFPKFEVQCGTNIENWIMEKLNLKPGILDTDYSTCNWTESFQPQTKRIRITIEELP